MPVSTTITHSGACLRDHFLLAMPSLEGGLFAHSVTYLCEHGESGAMGLVVNQPLDLNVAEIFEHLKIEACRDFSDEPVMAGGPVQLDHGFVLHRGARQNWDASLKVTEDLTLTTSRDILVAIAAGSGPSDYLIALGYAGWSAGQLEEELSHNSWLTAPANGDILFATPWHRRMSAAAGGLGIDMNLISAQAGHA
ncbi:MAG: YqgE/AlgH family protein [Halieaceae bacterium]|uniref:YqgE/AlgH family protein n=1 Tax=Haliea alexandrii TaxID=2448162 RepID=UPI000F0BC50D|nr:YqgE/AlgH family protein [Haliea alexandrii]MCR9185508.1 YqgE/AlgH family protein [Halieaceae bacterium]